MDTWRLPDIAMNPQVRTFLLNAFLATLGSLLSNVVANYLPPLFEEREWLAVGLFILITVLLFTFDLYQRGLWSPLGDIVFSLNRAERNQLLAILLPVVVGEQERRSLLFQALGEHPLYHQIDYSGDDWSFTLHLLQKLASDQPAFITFLGVVHTLVGTEQQAYLEAIQARIQQPPTSTSPWLKFGAALLVALLATVVWFAAPWSGDKMAEAAPSCPAARLCIGIATFRPLDQPAAEQVADQIEQMVRKVFDNSESQRFIVRKVSTLIENSEQARQQARDDGDLLMVWGEVFTALGNPAPISVNFEFADPMGVEAQSTSPYRALPVQQISDKLYCTQCLVGAVTQQAEIVAYMAAGLVHYVRGQPRRARLDFAAALYCAGELSDKTMNSNALPTCTPAPLGNWNSSLLDYYLGKAYFLEGDYANAVAYLTKAKDPAAQIGLAAVYKAWLALPTNGPTAHGAILHTEVFTATQMAEQLSVNLRQRVSPEMLPVIDFNLGLAYEIVEDLPATQAAYQRAAEGFGAQQPSGRYVALMGLARAQAEDGQVDEARNTLAQARALTPTLPWAYLLLARLDKDNHQQAESWVAQAARYVAPDEAVVDVTRAELCSQWQDYACATEAYTQALDKQPENGRLSSQVGIFYIPNPATPLPHQNWELAAKYFRKVANELRPKDPWAHQRLAYVLQSQTTPDDASAIVQYQTMLDLLHPAMHTSTNDLVASVYCNIGFSQQRMGAKDDAEQSYHLCAAQALSNDQRARAARLLAELH